MCGISGIINYDLSKEVDDLDLEGITDVIAHRGPDGFGYWKNNNIALGHRRLSIIDIDGSKQPMSIKDNLYTITYNGEIYNYLELKTELKDLGYSLQLVETSLIYHHGSISSNNSTSEGRLSAYVHYLNFKNHIYLLRKHSEKFNFFGVVLYQLIKLISYSIYFILRFRFNKLKMIYKGLIDGMKIKTS